MAIGGATDAEVYSDFQPPLTILTTVFNDQYEGRVTTDAGAKGVYAQSTVADRQRRDGDDLPVRFGRVRIAPI